MELLVIFCSMEQLLVRLSKEMTSPECISMQVSWELKHQVICTHVVHSKCGAYRTQRLQTEPCIIQCTQKQVSSVHASHSKHTSIVTGWKAERSCYKVHLQESISYTAITLLPTSSVGVKVSKLTRGAAIMTNIDKVLKSMSLLYTTKDILLCNSFFPLLILWQYIAGHTFRLVSIVSHLTMCCGANLFRIGCVKVV